jgi:hypothetical protein
MSSFTLVKSTAGHDPVDDLISDTTTLGDGDEGGVVRHARIIRFWTGTELQSSVCGTLHRSKQKDGPIC